MIDSNTHALNQYLELLDKEQIALETFIKGIEPELQLIEAAIANIRAYAKYHYEDYDFSDEIKTQLEALI